MPRQLSANEYSLIVAHGPKAELVHAALLAELRAIASIPLSSNYTTAVYSADGYYDMVIALTSSQAGAINLLRYVDDAGTILVETSPPTVALVAATAAVLISNDVVAGVPTPKPFASFKVQVTNTSGTTAATLSNIAALFSAR